MSVFAPDAFPEWLRVSLFWLGVALALFGVAATVWHFRRKIGLGKATGESTLPRPNFAPEVSSEFDYPYPKAVLKLRIQNQRGTRRGDDKGVPFAMSLAAQLQNDHNADLKNCSVVLREISGLERGNELTGLRFSLPKDGIVRKAPTLVSQFTMVRRNMSDTVTPEPFLLTVGGKTYPLSENSTYNLRLELISGSPHSTICHVQIDTGTDLDAEARIVSQEVAERTGGK